MAQREETPETQNMDPRRSGRADGVTGRCDRRAPASTISHNIRDAVHAALDAQTARLQRESSVPTINFAALVVPAAWSCLPPLVCSSKARTSARGPGLSPPRRELLQSAIQITLSHVPANSVTHPRVSKTAHALAGAPRPKSFDVRIDAARARCIVTARRDDAASSLLDAAGCCSTRASALSPDAVRCGSPRASELLAQPQQLAYHGRY